MIQIERINGPKLIYGHAMPQIYMLTFKPVFVPLPLRSIAFREHFTQSFMDVSLAQLTHPLAERVQALTLVQDSRPPNTT